jgi:23S rRNA-/tRNA-specific pseudouridylate synthase
MEEKDIRILFENDDVIVVDKDRGTAVHGGRNIDWESTLLTQVRRYLTARDGTEPAFLCPAHRIDLNTRGPVIFAKSGKMAKTLVETFMAGGVSKIYHALLEGDIDRPVFVQVDILKKGRKKSRVQNKIIMDTGYPSREEWLADRDRSSLTLSATLILPLVRHGSTTHCAVEIWTGRHHQIRAVCEAMGHPVCGDTKYNHDARAGWKRRTNPLYPDRQMLVCRRITVPSLGIDAVSGFEIEAINGNVGSESSYIKQLL